jgi:hypothetical protein
MISHGMAEDRSLNAVSILTFAYKLRVIMKSMGVRPTHIFHLRKR